uniref:Uncharacterized protein n=1 Tax=Panagrolaimus davidi TaxID=227884 RepID=A0A914PJK4_9BILA
MVAGEQFLGPRPANAQQLQHNDPKHDQIIRHLPVITPNTTILPTVDLTKPPPSLPYVRLPFQYGAPPPTFGGLPPGMGMPGGNGMPPPGYPCAPTVKKQSSDPIPSTDPPLLFNEVLKTKQAVIGADQITQNKSYELLRLTPSRDGRGRDSVRSRRSKPFQSSTNRKTSPKDTRPMWEKQAERFRKEMELISYNPSIDYDDVSKTESERISSGVAATKSSNDRQSHNNETFEEECGRNG